MCGTRSIVRTAPQTRYFYLNKSGQTEWLFGSNLNFRSSIPNFLQSSHLLVYIYKILSEVLQLLYISPYKNMESKYRTAWTIANCKFDSPLSNYHRVCCGMLICLLSCIGQFYIQVKIGTISLHAFLLFACFVMSGGSGICCASA